MTLNPLIGVGLRQPHYSQVLKQRPPIGWFEVHSENFFQYGKPLDILLKIRECYPLSLHGVGLSLGSAQGIEIHHLRRLQTLINQVNPFMISEHLSWSRVGNIQMPDLLPVPYTKECLNVFCNNINFVQDFLGREILIENPSTYLEYKDSYIQEADFLAEICKITGAKLLLDINNIYVSSSNNNWNAIKYIESIPVHLVKEIHLAGHSTQEIAPEKILRIDTHNSTVCSEVWDLYDLAIKRFGAILTLLEWDTAIPDLSFLIKEASKALHYLSLNQRYYEAA